MPRNFLETMNSSIRPFRYAGANSSLHCDQASLTSLAAKFGTPLYVYSRSHIAGRFEIFDRAFAHRPHLICYAVKANPNLSILKFLARMGSGFDIVSGGELERVLLAGRRAARRAVFSGVGKTAEEIDLALRTGILLFNVESGAEAELLAARARRLRLKARVSLRVNPDVFAETHPYISTGLREHKFGIGIGESHKIYRQMAKEPFLEPVGVSVHIGSQIRSAEPFGVAMERVAELVEQLKSTGIRIQYVDAGGGVGVEYVGFDAQDGKKRAAFDPQDVAARYAAAIDRALRGLDVTLLLEPGRFLVAQAGALLTRILYVKRNGRKNFLITDAGMNDLIRPALYRAHHEILPVVRDRAAGMSTFDVVGPVCETGDFFARGRRLQRAKSGDLLALLDTGADGMSLSSNDNSRPRPAEVLVEGGRARLIRKRETVADLLRAERSGLL